MKDNKTLIFFDKNVNDVFFLVQNNKVVKRLKFDRKKKKDMILLHEAILPKYTVNKNDLRTLTLIIEEEKNEKENEDKSKKKEDEQKHDNNIWDDDDIEENENKSDEKKEDIKEKKDK